MDDRAAARASAQRDLERLAVAQPLLKEGPKITNLSVYCEAMSLYKEGYMDAGVPDPAIAVRSLEAAQAVDESHAGCWHRSSPGGLRHLPGRITPSAHAAAAAGALC